MSMTTKIVAPEEIEKLSVDFLPSIRVTLGKKTFTRVIEPKMTVGSPLFEIFQALRTHERHATKLVEDLKHDLSVLAKQDNPSEVSLEAVVDWIIEELDKVPEDQS